MWKAAPWLCTGIIIGLVIVSVSGGRLTAQPVGFSTHTDPHCAMVYNPPFNVTSTQGSGGNAAFVCVGDLDGSGEKQVIVGQIDALSAGGGYSSYVNIINNTGALRQQICWVGSGSTANTPGCPPITASANTARYDNR